MFYAQSTSTIISGRLVLTKDTLLSIFSDLIVLCFPVLTYHKLVDSTGTASRKRVSKKVGVLRPVNQRQYGFIRAKQKDDNNNFIAVLAEDTLFIAHCDRICCVFLSLQFISWLSIQVHTAEREQFQQFDSSSSKEHIVNSDLICCIFLSSQITSWLTLEVLKTERERF